METEQIKRTNKNEGNVIYTFTASISGLNEFIGYDIEEAHEKVREIALYWIGDDRITCINDIYDHWYKKTSMKQQLVQALKQNFGEKIIDEMLDTEKAPTI